MVNTKIRKILKKFLNPNAYKQAMYTKYLEKKAIDERKIFYEAYHGESMTGNSFAVFIHLINDPRFKDYQHIWAIKDASAIPEEYRHVQNVTFVHYQSVSYIMHLATAKFLINDTTFPSYFQKRKDQVYANIWHGTPLKTMGLDIKNKGFADHKNIQRNFLFADYMISPNQFTYEKLLKSHDIYSIYNGKVVDCGYPRVDLMFRANHEKLRKSLSIPANKKIILYAPTWRGTIGDEKNESAKLLKDIQFIQQSIGNDYFVLLKSHYYAHRYFNDQNVEHLYVPNEVDTNELLSIVDVLITDYSSIFFDFLPTNLPILYYAYDEEEYVEKRGTYIPLANLPGPICKTVAEVVDKLFHLDEVKESFKEIYQEFQRKFCYHDDGKSTERLIDTVFLGKNSEYVRKTVTNKTKILLYGGGFLNNGITASVTNLLNSIDYSTYDVTLIDYGNVKEEKVNNMKALHHQVHIIYRAGTWNATILERFRHHFFLHKGAYKKWMNYVLPMKLYQRELERMIGLSTFDIGIDFSGYSPFWSSIFAFGDFKRKSIFLHSDMLKEREKKINNKYPHRKNLKVIFSLYHHYDTILSVSKLTHEQNMQNLKQYIGEYTKKMDYVINSIDYKNILSKKEGYQYEFAMEPDLSFVRNLQGSSGYPTPSKENINFITIGRLGPEKDHAKLINAFSEIVSFKDNVRLYIVGDGILKEKLLKQMDDLKLEKNIFFTGQLNNPYALLHQCDCFVLSSNQEGQPMVLLEALVLKKPVIVTDIPGSRSVVEGGYGLIVENSVKGLVEGMKKFIEGTNIYSRDFDYESYRNDAINMFYEKVCNLED